MDNLLVHLLLQAVGETGSYDPDECLYKIEESLTLEQYEIADSFLAWCHANGKLFGHGNIEAVYEKYQTSKEYQIFLDK